jgi:hypothetical protein
MRIPVHGTFHNILEGVKRGDIVDIDDDNARRYCALGYAQEDLKGDLGPGYQPAPARAF